MKHGKNYRAALAKYDASKKYDVATAVQTVKDYLDTHLGIEKVVFNVFSDSDRVIYENILG